MCSYDSIAVSLKSCIWPTLHPHPTITGLSEIRYFPIYYNGLNDPKETKIRTALRWSTATTHYENTPIQIYWKFYQKRKQLR